MNDELLTSIDRLARLVEYKNKIVLGVDGSVSIMTKPVFNIANFDKQQTKLQMVSDLILQSCEKSEQEFPGSSYLALQLIKTAIKQGNMHDDDFKLLIKKIDSVTKNVTKNDIIVCLSEIFSQQIVDIVIEAIELAGAERSIHVEPSIEQSILIRLTSGYMFNAEIDESFYSENVWEHEHVKCLIVDGIIQNVSEIDSILQRCHETQTPIIFFCRGISDDVRMTMLMNQKRKTLFAIPVIMKFGIETANSLSDIATVIGTDVISSLKGELISTIKFDDLCLIDRVICKKNTVTVHHKVKQKHVITKIAELQKKRNECIDPTKRMIYDARIKSLTQEYVSIRLPNQGVFGSTLISDIDTALKLTKLLLRFGIVNADDIEELQINDSAKIISRAKLLSSIRLASSLKSFIDAESFPGLAAQ